jgi:hypothetical protein
MPWQLFLSFIAMLSGLVPLMEGRLTVPFSVDGPVRAGYHGFYEPTLKLARPCPIIMGKWSK